MKKLFYLLLVNVLLLTACGDDDGDDVKPPQSNIPAPTIEPSDPNAVSAAIQVPGGTRVSGAMPAYSNDLSFELMNNTSDIIVSNGKSTYIDLVANNSFDGVYIQVNGADGYISAPVSSNRDAASPNKTQQTSVVELHVPASIKPGEFCITYSIFNNASGLVSNRVTRCVTVKQLGGNPAVVGNWQMSKFEDYENGSLISTYMVGGVMDVDTVSQFMGCPNDPLIYILEERLNSIHFNFSADGNFSETSNYTYEEVDSAATMQSCTAVKMSINEIEEENGSWSFNEATNEVTTIEVETYTSTDNSGNISTHTYTDVTTYKATTMSANQLVLEHSGVSSSGTSYKEVYHFSK